MSNVFVNAGAASLLLRRWLPPLFLFLCWCAPINAQEKPPLILAVVPQFSALTTHKAWAPFAERLEKETGLHIKLTLYKNVPEFESALLAGQPDLAFMNPYHQVMAKKAQAYVPLVRSSAESLFGIVVVAENGPIKNLKDLEGKVIAFPSPNSYAASLYVRALLTEQFGIKFKPHYYESHSDVYRNVILGSTLAGGGVMPTFSRESDDLRAQLRILYKTPPSAMHPLSAHPRVTAQQRQAIQAAILRLGADPSAKELLHGVQLGEPVIADYVKDYHVLEKLGLEKYVVPAP